MNNMGNNNIICKGMKKYGITGRRSHIKARVVDYLFKNGPSTSDMIANHLSDTTRWGGSTGSLSLILRRDNIFSSNDKVKIKSIDGGTYWSVVWDVNKENLYKKHGYKEG